MKDLSQFMKGVGVLLLLLCPSILGFAQVNVVTPEGDTDVETLQELAKQFYEEWYNDSIAVLNYATENNLPIRTSFDSGSYQIIKLVDGIPWYYTTNNLNAAKTTRTDQLWSGGSLGLSLDGSGITGLGIWDGGATLTTHQEFNNTGSSRVTQKDGATSLSNHATHVSGTLVAGGVSASAKGMSYNANLDAYDWNSDNSEMSTAASNGLIISNHSYGYVHGWSGSTWYGNASISTLEDYRFGFYSSSTRSWDLIANNAPYYLIVKSAGNDRNDAGNGTYPPDGNQGTGYDCIGTQGIAKNILTVGSVLDIANYTGPSSVSLNNFSSTGPADDGRIKPDIVANGNSLYSSLAGSNTSYGNYSGTSMSSPNTSGSLFLLQEHYKNLTGNLMRASTLKALVINTADEAGANEGPDYRFGWGLLNAQKAAQTITDAQSTSASIQEKILANGATDTIHVYSDGTQPLYITVVWNDPAHAALSASLDPTTKHLVNDLDLKVFGNSTTYYPYKLSLSNLSAAATNNSENDVDNVEHIYIANPTAGTYVIQIDHDGTLASNQRYSVIVRGIDGFGPPAGQNQAPTAAFTSTSNCLTVDFTDASSDADGSITAWLWNFGDGNSSTVQNPQHTYSTAGNYTVSLTVTDDSAANANTSDVVALTTNTYYADSDGDGYGNSNSTTTGCSPPTGYVTVAGDCDDNNANVNPGASEDCSNGIDDNCNQVIDESASIVSEGFENGWGIWNDGGSDCALSTASSFEGIYSAQIRDNSGNASSFWSDNIDLSPYGGVSIEFRFSSAGLSSGEDFWFQISTDGGNSYTTKKAYVNGVDFANGNWYFETFNLAANEVSSQTRFKFVCDASNKRDRVYVDNIVISGCSGSGGGATNQSPTAAFAASEDCLTVDFTDGSSDPDGSITAWSWSFGDGNT